MFTLAIWMCFGVAAGGLVGWRRTHSWLLRLVYLALGLVIGLVLALLAPGATITFAANQALERSKWIAATLFFAVLVAAVYGFINLLAHDFSTSKRLQLMRFADLAGAIATSLLIVGLLIWNIAMRV